jgi:hypothetical protein
MTGANMNLVTVNVKLGENDEDPQQHLDEVSFMNPSLPNQRTTSAES